MCPSDFQRLSRLLSLSAENRVITNIGNSATDFTTDGGITHADDALVRVGSDGDGVSVLNSAGLAINTPLTNVLIGIPVTPVAIAANSVIKSNVTASGDYLIAVNKGGTSHMAFMADGSTGDTLLGAPTGQSVDVYIAGAKEYDFSTATADFTGANIVNLGTLNTHTIQGGTSTLAMYSNNLSVFAATTSLQLLGVISDETGSGALVFATSPTLVTPALGTPASGVMTNVTGVPAAAILAGSFGAGAYVISASLQAATIELGHATDTTLARSGAGVVTIEGSEIVTENKAAITFQQATTISTTTGSLRLNPNTVLGFLGSPNGRFAITLGADSAFSPTGTGANSIAGARFDNNGITMAAGTTGDAYHVQIVGRDITVPDGTHPLAAGLHLGAPGKAGAGTITDGTTLYVAGAFTGAGTGNYSIWIDDGLSRFDAQVLVGFTAAGVNVTGNSLMASGGIAFTDVANAWIDDSAHGTNTVQHFIGTNTIDVTASDLSFKRNFSPPNGLAKEHLHLLASVLEEYDYVPEMMGGKRFIGYPAQHLYNVLPQYVVKGRDDNPWSVQYKYMVGPLLWGWQDHEDRITRLEHQLVAAGIIPEE